MHPNLDSWRMDIVDNTSICIVPTSKIVNNNGQIPDVPANPRTITKERYERLKDRIAHNNLLGVFPLKVYEYNRKFVALGGNQRLRAAKALEMSGVPCIIVPKDADAETLQEIIILENEHDGDNDWDALANNWDAVKLADWGVDAANWGIEPQKAEKKPREKRNCVYIELNDDSHIIIANTMYCAGDSIDASLLKQLLNETR